MNNCIEEMVRLGEDSVLEVKSIRIPGKHVVEPDAKDIADEIAAVANSSGAPFFLSTARTPTPATSAATPMPI